jgi:hypothetical protein
MKVLVGPAFKAIEQKLFSLPWFIKKIPRSGWPQYIMERCSRPGVKCIATDYTSFEASFIPVVMEAIEMELYDFMLQNVAFDYENDLIHSLVEKNILESAGLTAILMGRRMSGEMNTSLGNGFSNLMVNLFVLSEKGCTDVSGVIEGDDGLFVFQGPVPSTEDYLRLGFEIKLEEHQHYNEASFCGVVFAEEVGDNLMNPFRVLGTACWAAADYWAAKPENLRQLQIAKALSLLAQLPGCPVVQSVAEWQLRTANYDPKEKNEILKWVLQRNSTNWWERFVYLETSGAVLDPRPVAQASRELVAKKYGLSVAHQEELEKLFYEADGTVDLTDCDFIPQIHRANYAKYVQRMPKNDHDYKQPIGLVPDRPLEGERREDHHVYSGNLKYF